MPVAAGIGLAHEGWSPVFCGDVAARCICRRRLWSAAHYKSRVIFFAFNNARYNVLMNVAKGLGAKNALAGKYVGMDVVEPRTWISRRWRKHGRADTRADDPQAIAAAITEATTRGAQPVEIAIA